MRGALASRTPRSPDVITSVYLWGSNRAEVNQLAARVAQRIDPHFAWVEALDAESREPSTGALRNGVAAPIRDFAPPRGVSGERVFTYLRRNGQRHDAQELQSFTQMSEPIQAAIAQLLERNVPRVLVVANLERLREYFCDEQPGPHPFIEWLNAHEITLVASSTGGPLREGVHFDYLVTEPEGNGTRARSPLVVVGQRSDLDRPFLEQALRPRATVWLSGLSPSAPPTPNPLPRLATG